MHVVSYCICFIINWTHKGVADRAIMCKYIEQRMCRYNCVWVEWIGKKGGRRKKKKEKKREIKEGKRRSKNSSGSGREGYKRYVFKVLKQVHPEIGISGQAMLILNNFMNDMFQRLAEEATKLSKYTGVCIYIYIQIII